MSSISKKAIIETILYYDLLQRPLTPLEVFKYSSGKGQRFSFFELQTALADNPLLEKKKGLYFLKGKDELVLERERRTKLAQVKWRKLKNALRFLSFIPFIEMVAVTGSMTAYNTKKQSDFDLLITCRQGRLWLTRIFVTLVSGVIDKRRHGQKTKDRLCLNCYLAHDGLEISEEAKTHNFHSAQEYGRLIPVFENKQGLYEFFVSKNKWLAEFLNNFPWPKENLYKIEQNPFCGKVAGFFEWVLGGKAGDWLERISGKMQLERINEKNENLPSDQIYVSSRSLIFHPQSKSFELMANLNKKLKLIENI